LRIFTEIIGSSDFHHLLNGNSQSRLFWITTPKVVDYSLIIRVSSIVPHRLILARLENFHENRVGLGILHGYEHLITM